MNIHPKININIYVIKDVSIYNKYPLNVVQIFTRYWFTYPVDIYETLNCGHLDIYSIYNNYFSYIRGYP